MAKIKRYGICHCGSPSGLSVSDENVLEEFCYRCGKWCTKCRCKFMYEDILEGPEISIFE